MKKYLVVDIEHLLNHKMMFEMNEDIDQSNDVNGVCGMGIRDARFNYVSTEKYVKGIRYKIFGQKNKYDNLVCHNQEIELSEPVYATEIALLGFNEFGTYFDKLSLVTVDHKVIELQMLFYQFMENVNSLYDCDKSEACQIGFLANVSAYMKGKYYYNHLEVNQEISKIILPDNEEMHICAITIIK